MSAVRGAKAPEFDYASLDEAFPSVDPELEVFGSRVLIQIRTPKTRSASGIILPEETRETELWNTQVAKVIAVGPGAFKNRDTMEEWPEGSWCKPGDFVRCPKHGGDRWEVLVPGTQNKALFAVVRDLDLIGAQKGDPLKVIAFI